MGNAESRLQSAELEDSLKRLYSSREYSDLTISCDGRDHQVHKAIVCPRSEFFAAACRGAFEEERKATINLPDDDPQLVDIMVQYLYHLDYNTPSPAGRANKPSHAKLTRKYRELTSDLVTHVMVYALAKKYDIRGLKSLAIQKFEAAVEKQWLTYSFLEAVQEIYTSTTESDRELRDVVISTFYAHPDLLDKKATQVIFKELGVLSYDLLMHLRHENCWPVVTKARSSR
ncbi:BTB/POZ protein [Biscogniauxia marginata]|nr:BTB/POZ protein [Biscogniauxia marginata]